MRNLTPKSIDVSGDMIALAFEDETGEACEAKFSTLDAATLMYTLEMLIPKAIDTPEARSPRLPGMHYVQLLQNEEEVCLRISVGEHGVFHDYPVPANTTLANDLKFLADRVAARQEAQVTHSQFDSPARKN